jgi:purine-binding chemotaxis protein CheW
VEIESIKPVPQAPLHVAGLAALRSRVLTVIDCSAALELGSGTAAGRSREAIVIAADGHPYALLVDTVEDVIEHGGEVHPVRSSISAAWRRVSTGMVETDRGLMLLVDPDVLLAGPAAEAA